MNRKELVETILGFGLSQEQYSKLYKLFFKLISLDIKTIDEEVDNA